ncbi:MAG: histidine kinase [Chloroflexota bacterium]|nr:histidine kinase [Chloroflexota bacterium]
MPPPLRVLILEDRPADAKLMLRELHQAGFEPDWECAETEADYVAALRRGTQLYETFDVILADYSLPQFDALRALHLLREYGLDIPFIVITGSVSEEVAVECMKQGAADYLLKDRLARLGPAVTNVLQEKKLRDERKQAEKALESYTKQLRTMAVQLAEAEEIERQRIARDLHDQVGQNLTALGINLNIVRSQMSGDVPDSVRSRLDDSLALVEQMSERIRDVIADLRPPVLDDYGLMAALRWHSEQFASQADITVVVEGEKLDPRLNARVESALFHIAQEALTNVAKHAQAEHATVTVKMDGKTVRLVVADDGVGFDVTHANEPGKRGGWGLLTMVERAEAVGARYRIETRPSQGTRVIVEVER